MKFRTKTYLAFIFVAFISALIGHLLTYFGFKDLVPKNVHWELERLQNVSLLGMLSSIVISLCVAFYLSEKLSTSLLYLCEKVKQIGKGNLEQSVQLTTDDEFNDLALAINDMSKGLKEREKLKNDFARYVSHQVLEKILNSENKTFLQGERKKVTVLFSDIRHFTKLAEQLSPEEVVSILNQYFAVMLDCIFEYAGTLDKFTGDGVMVEFGAPLEDSKQEEHALLAALSMQEKLETLRQKWRKENKPELEMGIGIHTGLAVVGNIGSEKRLEYTAIGDTVNVASRLEHATKALKIPILVSESTIKGAPDIFLAQDLGPMTLLGRSQEIVVYALYGKK